MGSRGLKASIALSSLFSITPVTALELDLSQDTLALVEQGCAYGRGALAIESAKAEAFSNLRLFLNGETSLSLTDQESTLVNEHFSESQREALVSGIEQGVIHANFDAPEILGDDTCVNVRLTPPSESSDDGFEIEWDDEGIVSIVVIGEGKSDANRGLTARQAAEQDAFRRAISQVLGVMVKSGYLNQSHSVMSASADSDEFNLHDVAIQSLSLDSQGMISGWNEISSQQRDDGMFLLTLDVTVEREKVNEKVMRLIDQLGNPSIYVDAKLPAVKSRFNAAFSEMGFDLAHSVEQSTVIMQIDEVEKVTPSGLQLALATRVLDRAGNQYGEWSNDPSLITLPNKEGMLNELATVHLALESNKIALTDILHKSVQTMAMRGGPVREVILSTPAAGKQGQLYTLLSSINGVSDVKIQSYPNKVVVQLRSMSNANELAQYIEPTLRIHQPNYSSRLSVLNDYQINVL
ncbi:hypothetical protein [Vibrio agarivorans]|uniref:hypothetical protein n=1 Tax=Vibrio agarivorans TaxID=153622 RepID=UPI00222ED37A|nr:hypothetical protein [Vibrio agarivorans]MDN3660397.1 hypothetical protein [Vibrio agarivorans]